MLIYRAPGGTDSCQIVMGDGRCCFSAGAGVLQQAQPNGLRMLRSEETLGLSTLVEGTFSLLPFLLTMTAPGDFFCRGDDHFVNDNGICYGDGTLPIAVGFCSLPFVWVGVPEGRV